MSLQSANATSFLKSNQFQIATKTVAKLPKSKIIVTKRRDPFKLNCSQNEVINCLTNQIHLKKKKIV